MKIKSYVKVISLLQVLCLISVLLSSCAQKVDSSTPENDTVVPSATDAATQPPETNTSTQSNISVSLPIIPPLVTEQKTGALVELVKAMAEEYEDGEISFDVYPMARSIENILSGTADCHSPYVKQHNVTDSDDKFYYTTEPFGMVIYVLYTNKNVKGLTPENVMDKKFNVEMQLGVKEYIGDFPESAPDAGLQKLDSGRIDGYIAAMDVCDPLLAQLQLKNIKRQKYDSFDTAIIFKKNAEGKKKQEIMNSLIKSIKDNGSYDKIMGEINSKEVFIPDED